MTSELKRRRGVRDRAQKLIVVVAFFSLLLIIRFKAHEITIYRDDCMLTLRISMCALEFRIVTDHMKFAVAERPKV